MAQIVSLISGKGGTGKTSLCAGIAACLARDGFRVLAIDLDVGLRNLDIALGMADEAALPFTAVMRGETPIEQATPHPSQSRLSLLTAPVREQIESIGLRPFGAMLRQAKGKFDWILLDAPAGLGRGFQLATAFADEAIVVTLADPASQRDAARATELLLAKRDIPVRMAVNRVSPKLFTRMQSTVDDVMDLVGLPLLGLVRRMRPLCWRRRPAVCSSILPSRARPKPATIWPAAGGPARAFDETEKIDLYIKY